MDYQQHLLNRTAQLDAAKAAEYSEPVRRALERFAAGVILPACLVLGLALGALMAPAWAQQGLEYAPPAAPTSSPWEQGEAVFPACPHPGDREIPLRFALEPHRFPYQQRSLGDVSRTIAVSLVQFPSPVNTTYAPNNTVHCEYYQPLLVRQPTRGVIVLHILGGDFALSRLFCNLLAQHGVAALFVKMPYYGPRRPPDESARRAALQPKDTVVRMDQAILDIRRGAAWLGNRPEVDPRQLGVFGISLGGITGALAAEAEPRLQHVCLTLAGGDLAAIVWSSPESRKLQEKWKRQGITQRDLEDVLRPIDPLTWADRLRDRHVLMINAKEDEVIPRACTEKLWLALGQPPIQWYEGGHYSFGNIFKAMDQVARFYTAPNQQ